MVATLYKKKPTFNIESVNTDYSTDLPPFFLGIRNAAFINFDQVETENILNEGLDKFYSHYLNKVSNLDEEDLYVNEELSLIHI